VKMQLGWVERNTGSNLHFTICIFLEKTAVIQKEVGPFKFGVLIAPACGGHRAESIALICKEKTDELG
jgi:hypothetical protein